MKKYRILNIALALSLCLPMNWMTTSCEDMLEEKGRRGRHVGHGMLQRPAYGDVCVWQFPPSFGL